MRPGGGQQECYGRRSPHATAPSRCPQVGPVQSLQSPPRSTRPTEGLTPRFVLPCAVLNGRCAANLSVLQVLHRIDEARPANQSLHPEGTDLLPQIPLTV